MTVAVEDHRSHVAHLLTERLRYRFEVRLRGRVDIDDVGRGRTRRDLVHVDAGTGIEHRAALAHGDDCNRAAPSKRGERRAVDGIDGDVHAGRRTVADLLAVEEHRGFVLLALADDHDAFHPHRAEHHAHRLYGGAVGRVLVAAAHPPTGGQRGGLGGAHELHCEVAIGRLLRFHFPFSVLVRWVDGRR